MSKLELWQDLQDEVDVHLVHDCGGIRRLHGIVELDKQGELICPELGLLLLGLRLLREKGLDLLLDLGLLLNEFRGVRLHLLQHGRQFLPLELELRQGVLHRLHRVRRDQGGV